MTPIDNVTTADDLATALCRAVKLKKWHTFLGTVAGKAVSVKICGLWPQVFRVDGVSHAPSVELKTQKALKAFVLDAIAYTPPS
jgi:hypothetical protein